MSKPESRGPGRAPMPAAKVNAFFHHLGRTGSVTVAANRAQLRRSTLYERRQDDEEFAERWSRALDLGVERLQDNAMNRALNGTPRPIWRNGQEVGSVRQFDNRLLQFLLKAHRPDLYGDRGKAAAPSLPFDLVKRMADAEARLAEREKGGREKKKPGAAKKPAAKAKGKTKGTTHAQ